MSTAISSKTLKISTFDSVSIQTFAPQLKGLSGLI